MPTHEEMVRVVERYVEAFDNEDPDMVVALFAADATVEDPVGMPAHHGADAIRAFYTRSMTSSPKLTLDGPVRTAGNFAAFPFTVRLNYGGEKKIDVIDTFRFNDKGEIAEMRAFFSPQNMQGFE